MVTPNELLEVGWSKRSRLMAKRVVLAEALCCIKKKRSEERRGKSTNDHLPVIEQ